MLRQGATRIIGQSGHNYISLSQRGFHIAAKQRLATSYRPVTKINNIHPNLPGNFTAQKRSLSLWPFSKSSPSSTAETTNSSTPHPNDPYSATATTSSAPPPTTPSPPSTSPEGYKSFTPDDTLSSSVASQVDSHVPEGYVSASQSLAELDLGHGVFVGTAQKILCGFHDLLPNLPWWATLTIAVLGIRFAMLPAVVWAQRASSSFARIQPEFQAILDEINAAKKERNLERTHILQLKASKLLKDNNANPMRSLLLPMIQISTFLPFFLAVRSMTNANFPLFDVGGLSWFHNLTLPDPFYILPISSVVTTILVLEFGMSPGAGNNQAQMAKPLFRALILGSGFYLSTFPASVLVYWTASNTFNLIQTFSFKLKPVKKFLGLPDPPSPPPPKLDEFGKPIKPPGFLEGMKKSYNAIRIEDTQNKQDRGKIYGIHQPTTPSSSNNKSSSSSSS